jgi:hypothetical protein
VKERIVQMNQSHPNDADVDRDNSVGHVADGRLRAQPSGFSAGERIYRVLTGAICAWALFEIPLELDPLADASQVAATVIAKLIWIIAGTGAIFDAKGARLTFAFLSGVSIVAITPSLPFEFRVSTIFFGVSSVEIVMKALSLMLFIRQRFTGREPG